MAISTHTRRLDVDQTEDRESLTPATIHAFFAVVLATSIVIVLMSTLAVAGSTSGATVKDAREFRRFQVVYVSAYSLMTLGDWLQGPYLYALYAKYGLTHDDIGTLFIAGFGSSMVFGTFAGSLADRIGRKKGALLYVATYALSCATKHWRSYSVLLIGRLLGGVSTSLLCSVFEAWLVTAHAARGLDPALLATIFANAQACNSLAAIASGVVGDTLARTWPLHVLYPGDIARPLADDGAVMVGGLATPFDAAALVLLAGAFVVLLGWEENRGDTARASILTASVAVWRDARLLYLGAIAACFEAAMYAFIFEWTPALATESGAEGPPNVGEIFSIMMLSCTAGASLFAYSKDRAMTALLWTSALALSPPVLLAQRRPLPCLVAFVLFELCVGAWFPAVATLKSRLVPDALRSTVYNLFRLPLNLLVLALLVAKPPPRAVFAASTGLLLTAATLHRALLARLDRARHLLASDDDL